VSDVRWPLVYDAGALLAADRLLSKRRIIVPAPVLAQAWRDGRKQARLSRLLNGCEIQPTSEETAKAAGVLLGTSGTSDAIDAIVVATALALDAHVLTSDPKDLNRLADAANAELTLIAV
jgi:predicted nucleic acid-binding protein